MNIIVWIAVLMPWIAEAGKGFWFLDLFNHFRIQMGIGLLGMGAGLIWAGRPVEAAAALAGAGFCARSVWDRARVESDQTDGNQNEPALTLSVLTCNVWFINKGHRPLAQTVHAKDPDVVVLLETDFKWFDAMREPLAHYQHHKAHPQDDGFGLAVYSKHPMIATVERFHEKANANSIRCLIRHPAGEFVLWAMHPEPPLYPAAAFWHRGELREVARRVHEDGLPTVITGDLNTSTWGRNFREYFKTFKDSGRGKGLATTWPSPLPAFLRIPIDHLLHTDHLETLSHEILPNMGSDHKPIYVRLARRRATKES
ncbi:MAG: endonuclease/exonuclease/phosphatase family protein [Candidatus Omnitrophica bacterium]|nr:endonuclease/exonuclease/phosphatase family protein [Candidatus Omnitrophota bacterium]